jgi:hypothetical protein
MVGAAGPAGDPEGCHSLPARCEQVHRAETHASQNTAPGETAEEEPEP